MTKTYYGSNAKTRSEKKRNQIVYEGDVLCVFRPRIHWKSNGL